MIGPFYMTMMLSRDGVDWDLRSGTPDGVSVRVASGTSFTWAAATHRAGTELMAIARKATS